MTYYDFESLLVAFEDMILKNKCLPASMVIDEKILYQVFPRQTQGVRIVKYVLPLSGYTVPVERGRSGEFKLKARRA